MDRHVVIRGLQLFSVMLLGLGLAACGSGSDGAATESTASSVTIGVDDTTTTLAEGTEGTTTATVAKTSTSTTEQQGEAFVVVSGAGLSVLETGGAGSMLDFGADRLEVIQTVGAALGTVPVESEGNAECPNAQASVATWPDLILEFDATDQFLSWRLPVGSQLTDADGLGLGSQRSDLGDTLLASVSETTLGTEFGLGGSVSGLLTGPEEDATVDVLWAGDICAFR